MKRIFCLLMVLFLLCTPVLTVFANSTPGFILDEADMLSQAEIARLQDKAIAIYLDAQLSVYTLVTEDSLDADYCREYMDQNSLGYGENNDGLLLVVDFGDGTVSLFPNGAGVDLFESYQLDVMRGVVIEHYNYADGTLYDGLLAFYTACAGYLGVEDTDNSDLIPDTSVNCPEDLLELTGTGKLDAHVIDRADLLSDSEEQALNARIDQIVKTYGLDVVILTENAIGGYRPQLYADWFFLNHECGVGAAQDGVLFLLSMKDRDWYLCTHGKGIQIFTDYGINDVLGESAVISSFTGKEYASGFHSFLDLTVEFCDAYQAGTPFDTNHKYRTTAEKLQFVGIAFVVSLIISLVIVSGFKKQLKTARPQRAAQSYVVPGSLDLRTQKDLFLYSSVSRVAKPKNTSSGGGGSSTHSTGGSSFGGGGGKF